MKLVISVPALPRDERCPNSKVSRWSNFHRISHQFQYRLFMFLKFVSYFRILCLVVRCLSIVVLASAQARAESSSSGT